MHDPTMETAAVPEAGGVSGVGRNPDGKGGESQGAKPVEGHGSPPLSVN